MKFRWMTVALVLFAAVAVHAQDVDIPYQKFVLDNGLTVIVHEDHKAPIVAVNTWYHVGSKNEKPGKTGFAHLFEHLMFGGSEHSKDRYIDAMERKYHGTDPYPNHDPAHPRVLLKIRPERISRMGYGPER